MIKSVQLYSLREEIASGELPGVLKDIKACGFDAVETAGFYGLSYKEFKKLLDDAGLLVTSTHTQLAEILENPQSVYEMAEVLGTKNIIVPYLGDLVTESEKHVENMEKASRMLLTKGLRLGYHNHSHEFGLNRKDGSDFLKLLKSGVKDIVFELDIFWLKAAGLDFTEYAAEFGRDELLTYHLKEMSLKGKDAPAPKLGDGCSQTEKAIKDAVKRGMDFLVLEFEGIDIDYKDYLKSAAEYIDGQTK